MSCSVSRRQFQKPVLGKMLQGFRLGRMWVMVESSVVTGSPYVPPSPCLGAEQPLEGKVAPVMNKVHLVDSVYQARSIFAYEKSSPASLKRLTPSSRSAR